MAAEVGLSEAEIEAFILEYKQEGYVVVPIFTAEEVSELRRNFHESLGVDHEALLSAGESAADLALKTVGGPRVKSKAAMVYAPQWKLNACTDARLLSFVRRLQAATFGPADVPQFSHPFGRSDDVVLFLDCAQYRLPDTIRAEGGLGLHLDRNPTDPYLLNISPKQPAKGGKRNTKPVSKRGSASSTSALTKFRPIQSFIALTDQYGSESGGLRVVPGFHKEHDQYFRNGAKDEESLKHGEFFRFDATTHATLWSRAIPVDVAAGSVVFWDNRLPHSTAQKLTSFDTREILYTAYLPSIPLNLSYAAQQLIAIRNKEPPPAFQSGSRSKFGSQPQYFEDETALTPEQKKLLTITTE